MVDVERLHRILRRITDDLAVLRTYAELDAEELLADPPRLGHVKYLFVTLLEGCVDAAHHICTAEGSRRSPATWPGWSDAAPAAGPSLRVGASTSSGGRGRVSSAPGRSR